jgi:carbamoyltransferase
LTETPVKPPPPSKRDLRNFGFTFGVVAAVIAAFLFSRGRASLAQNFLVVSAGFFAVGAIFPAVLRPAFGPWMKFAEILGYINTRLLLGLFYYVGMTPTGLLMRLAGKDPMTRTFRRKDSATYWSKPAPHVDGNRHFDRQF